MSNDSIDECARLIHQMDEAELALLVRMPGDPPRVIAQAIRSASRRLRARRPPEQAPLVPAVTRRGSVRIVKHPPRPARRVEIEGVVYGSLKSAADATGRNYSTLWRELATNRWDLVGCATSG